MALQKMNWRSVESGHFSTTYPITYELELCVFGYNVRLQCSDPYIHSLLMGKYGSCYGRGKDVKLRYFITRSRHSAGFTVFRNGSNISFARDEAKLLSSLEKEIVNHLQLYRRDLYLVHAAAVEFRGRAFLLMAPLDGDKSITTWGLLQKGFRYMSDGVTGIRLDTIKVCSYPQALSLKSRLPAPYELPSGTFETSGTTHIPVASLPNRSYRAPVPLGALFFTERDGWNCPSAIVSMSKAEAAACLYTNCAYSSADKKDSLDAAIRITRDTTCLRLVLGDLSEACTLIKEIASSRESGCPLTAT